MSPMPLEGVREASHGMKGPEGFGIDSEANAAQQTSGKKILPDACGESAKTTLISQIDGFFQNSRLKNSKGWFFSVRCRELFLNVSLPAFCFF